MIDIQWYVVLGAFALDFKFGDPGRWPHPVALMGNAISFFEPVFRRIDKNPVVSGWLFAVFLIGSTWLLGLFIVLFSMAIHPFVGMVVQGILLFFCFSSRTLEKEAMKVFWTLKNQGIDAARKQVAMIVGRQTENLDEKGVTRACVETVAENFVDGFLSPLFFALIGGVPAALAYKMVNTLDSMVGYKNEQYFYFGRASAQIDDVANFIPSKFSEIISLTELLFTDLHQLI
ncbi:MAG: adenosylcobinamide-phosphate synthase CbiB, partial [Proteobacteria bacterium]|nr:adenosylcobinamide-phosphate synthase CbiB [Pseudomonadota bacterium]